MGNSKSKKCDDMKVVMEFPKKFELKFLESNVYMLDIKFLDLMSLKKRK